MASSVLPMSKSLIEYGDILREWSVSTIRPHARQADFAHAPPDDWREILATCPVPLGEGRGDDAVLDFDDGHWVSRLVTYENLNYGDPWLQPLLGGGIGYLVVESMGTGEQIERWGAKQVYAQGWMTAFSLTEPHFGSDVSQVSTTASRADDGWSLNGRKIYCSVGATADYIVVFATVDKTLGPKGINAFLVPSGTPGLQIAKANETKLGLRSWVTSELLFEDCTVPLDHRLGYSADDSDRPRASGLSGALGALSFNRPNMAALAIGIAQASLDVTRERLVDMRAGFAPRRWAAIDDELRNIDFILDRGRRLNINAQRNVDAGKPDASASAMAKAYSPQTCERVIRRCMQLIGPEGCSRELLLEKWYRDSKILDIFEGSGQIQRLMVGRAMMGRSVG